MYRNAETLRRADRTGEAAKVADQGLTAWRGRPEWYHRFRILKAELLSADEPQAALALLDSPDGVAVPDLAEIRAGYLHARGYALAQLRRYPEARDALQKARAIAAAAGLAPLESIVLVRLGTVLFFLGERGQAQECYRTALARAETAGDAYLEARAQEAIGFLDLNNSRYDECVTWTSRALHAYQSIGAELRAALVSDTLGWCDYRLGNHDAAQVLFAADRRLFMRRQQWRALGINLNANGAAAIARDDLPAARSCYEQVIDLATRTGDIQTLADGRTNLATTLILMGDIPGAEAVNTQAQNIASGVPAETRWRMKLNSGRIAAAQGKQAEAESICRSVAGSGVRQPRLLIDADVLLARVLDSEKRPREAEKALQNALARLDDSRAELLRDESKLTYSAGLIRAFQDYVDLLCRENRPLEALEIAESSRARLLAEQADGGKRVAKPAELRELARSTDTVFLFYWMAPVRSHLWAIAPSGIEHIVLPAKDEISQLVNSYRRFIDNFGDPLSTPSSGRELYAALIQPVEHLLRAGSHVVIVPDDPLFDISLESLPSPRGRPHYWLEDATVSVAPSLSILLRRASADRAPEPRLLLIGDPLSAGEKDSPRLANARAEMDAIRAQYPGVPSVLRAGADATPDSYGEAAPADFSIIHFAAHATANRESPLDSAVVLTPRGGNYKLYAREIRRHPIHAELVTISACRSAGARSYAGEGLVGFAWAFLGAGARNVIAGLWEVDDRSTAQLMEATYGELRRGAPPADALRQAKLRLATSAGSFRKPYYWAPFQLFTVSVARHSVM